MKIQLVIIFSITSQGNSIHFLSYPYSSIFYASYFFILVYNVSISTCIFCHYFYLIYNTPLNLYLSVPYLFLLKMFFKNCVYILGVGKSSFFPLDGIKKTPLTFFLIYIYFFLYFYRFIIYLYFISC